MLRICDKRSLERSWRDWRRDQPSASLPKLGAGGEGLEEGGGPDADFRGEDNSEDGWGEPISGGTRASGWMWWSGRLRVPGEGSEGLPSRGVVTGEGELPGRGLRTLSSWGDALRGGWGGMGSVGNRTGVFQVDEQFEQIKSASRDGSMPRHDT